MEERKYFKKICSSVLGSSPRILFAGIIDKSGRLLAGRKRESILVKIEDKIVPLLLLNYIIEAIEDLNLARVSSSSSGENINQTIQVSICELWRTVLLVIPITGEGDKFLAIYVEEVWLNESLLAKLIQHEIRY